MASGKIVNRTIENTTLYDWTIGIKVSRFGNICMLKSRFVTVKNNIAANAQTILGTLDTIYNPSVNEYQGILLTNDNGIQLGTAYLFIENGVVKINPSVNINANTFVFFTMIYMI